MNPISPHPALPARPLAALRHLRAADPSLAPVIDAVGPFRLPRRPATLHQLCLEVIGQQLSIVVAARIGERFTALAGSGVITPERLLSISSEDLRGIGLSGAKVTTVHGLAEFWRTERLDGARLAALSDAELLALLTQVKGIGPWTAKMFLIFCLNRPDVLPQEDLGLRAAIRRIDALEATPSPRDIPARVAAWTPWSTVATWYCWQYLKT